MDKVEHITTFQIDAGDYTAEYADYLLSGCREMYPTKKILASIEFCSKAVLMSVYAKDGDTAIGYEFL